MEQKLRDNTHYLCLMTWNDELAGPINILHLIIELRGFSDNCKFKSRSGICNDVYFRESKTTSFCHVHNRTLFFQFEKKEDLIIGGVFSVHTF